MPDRFSRLRRFSAVIGLVLAGALVMALGPVGILADQENTTEIGTGIDQFKPITVSEQTLFDLEAVAEDLDPMTMVLLYMEIQDLGEFETSLSEESLHESGSLDDVEAHLNGAFLTPSYLPDGIDSDDSRFKTGDAGFAQYTFDVGKARRISELLELPTDWLPDPSEHDHLTVRIDVPESGLAAWEAGHQKLVIGQVGAPEIHVPEELDLEALRDAVLNDPRMPSELRSQLGEIDDWERTLPVPVPEDAEYRDITVDGHAGFLVSMDDGSAAVWEADGTLHFVAGTFAAEEIERVAGSLK